MEHSKKTLIGLVSVLLAANVLAGEVQIDSTVDTADTGITIEATDRGGSCGLACVLSLLSLSGTL